MEKRGDCKKGSSRRAHTLGRGLKERYEKYDEKDRKRESAQNLKSWNSVARV